MAKTRPANPLDDMTWETRFWTAFDAVLRMTMRYEDAETEISQMKLVIAEIKTKPQEPRIVLHMDAKRERARKNQAKYRLKKQRERTNG